VKLLVSYATTEGQTRKVARFVADRLAGAGHAVELLPAGEAEGLDPGRFDRAILAGSIHGGRFQKELEAFATAEAAALGQMPTLFLAVSLSAAGEDPEDWQGLHRIVADFQTRTGWTPDRVEHVAGAFRFGEYDFFRAWAMRWIAREKGQTVDPRGDTEYTDWAALGAAVDAWLAA
jgi:menaquinone-dependent protoporphyrinogen oxidase